MAVTNDAPASVMQRHFSGEESILTFDGFKLAEDRPVLEEPTEPFAFGAVSGVVVFVTTGYMLWALRAGVLLASAMNTLPTWTQFDPLPVLDYADKVALGRKQKDEDRQEAHLETLVG